MASSQSPNWHNGPQTGTDSGILIGSTNQTIMDPDSFMSEAMSAYITHKEDLSYGQFLVNELSRKYPSIILPEEADCYYDNKKIPNFLRFIYSYDSSKAVTEGQD